MTISIALGTLQLLGIFLGPFFALALPLTKGSKLGWVLFVISCIAILASWDAYKGTSEVYYIRGDTVDYNLKKPDFALFTAMSSVTIYAFIYFSFEQNFFGVTSAQRLLSTSKFLLFFLFLGIATYHFTFASVRHQDWGGGQCEEYIDATGLPSCKEDRIGLGK